LHGAQFSKGCHRFDGVQLRNGFQHFIGAQAQMVVQFRMARRRCRGVRLSLARTSALGYHTSSGSHCSNGCQIYCGVHEHVGRHHFSGTQHVHGSQPLMVRNIASVCTGALARNLFWASSILLQWRAPAVGDHEGLARMRDLVEQVYTGAHHTFGVQLRYRRALRWWLSNLL
jgi:hypothetical protein